LGIGFSTYIEPAPGPRDFAKSMGFDLPSETAWARLEPTGDLTVTTWQVPHGQGHETTLAQVTADEMGLPMERVRIVYGDSAASPLPDGMRQGLEAVYDFPVPEGGWAQATHCCWVDVDIETGAITIPRYLVVEDCGELINPAIVDGQIRGGVAQGVAAVLYER